MTESLSAPSVLPPSAMMMSVVDATGRIRSSCAMIFFPSLRTKTQTQYRERRGEKAVMVNGGTSQPDVDWVVSCAPSSIARLQHDVSPLLIGNRSRAVHFVQYVIERP